MVVCAEEVLGSKRGIKKWRNEMEPNNRLHFPLWILAFCIFKMAAASRVPHALLATQAAFSTSSSSSSSSSLLAIQTTANSSSSTSSQSLNSKSHSSSHSKQKKGSNKKNGKQYGSPPTPKHAPSPTPTPMPTPTLAPPPPRKPKNDHHMGGGDGYYYPSSNIFDVLSFGAQGDGETDDTEAFVATWQQACQVESSVFEVPAYFVFVVAPIVFSGPCAYNIIFQIDGTIKPLGDSDVWGTSSKPVLHWLEFAKVNSLVVQGDGVVDGTGDCWWSLACKAKRPNGHRISRPCESPTALRFFGSYNVTVRDVVMRNSPQMHLKFDDCVEVMVDNVTISSPSNSPNTDGIHIQNTQIVDIRNSLIQTGDDCISIQTGCSNVEVQNVVCGHGHGISIGGLGQEQTQACVSNISVHDVLIQDSQNGLRIKTWQGGSGSVRNVEFRDIQVRNTSNPIIIDQYYCDAKSCKNQTSAVHVTGVRYNNIRGTYWRDQPIRLSCSNSVPCTDIILSEVELLPENGYYVEDPFCWNSYGVSLMPTIPPVDCLQDGLPLQSQPLSNADSC